MIQHTEKAFEATIEEYLVSVYGKIDVRNEVTA